MKVEKVVEPDSPFVTITLNRREAVLLSALAGSLLVSKGTNELTIVSDSLGRTLISHGVVIPAGEFMADFASPLYFQLQLALDPHE